MSKTYDHAARPDDLPEPGDRCKDCGEDITWMGPGWGDWLHFDEQFDDPEEAERYRQRYFPPRAEEG